MFRAALLLVQVHGPSRGEGSGSRKDSVGLSAFLQALSGLNSGSMRPTQLLYGCVVSGFRCFLEQGIQIGGSSRGESHSRPVTSHNWLQGGPPATAERARKEQLTHFAAENWNPEATARHIHAHD